MMPRSSHHGLTGAARLAAALVALAAWAGLVIQFEASFGADGDVLHALVVMLRYFTVIANLLAAGVFTGVALGWPPASAPAVLGGTTLALLLVGIVYAALLRGLFELSGGAVLADTILHRVTPVLVPAFWLGLAPKGGLRWRDPLVWAVLPLAYVVYALLRGGAEGRYAYPFLDGPAIGWPRVAGIALVMAAGFLLAGFAMVWLDRRLAPRGR